MPGSSCLGQYADSVMPGQRFLSLMAQMTIFFITGIKRSENPPVSMGVLSESGHYPCRCGSTLAAARGHITHILSFSIRKVPALRDGCSSFIPMALKKSNCAKSDKIQLSSNNTFQPQLHSQSSSAHHLQRIVIQLFQIKRKSSRCITTAALF